MRSLICGATILLALSACGSGGGDEQESQSSNSNAETTTITETTAECYFVPGNGSAVNVGPVESEEAAAELERSKSDYFIASCTGDVNVTIDNSTTTTTTTAETTTQIDSGNTEAP